jgi:hypothetical protein
MPPVVTAVISDLHLGTRTEADLLRRPEVRETLMTELAAVDHVVLLGDTIELRDRHPSEALEAAATTRWRRSSASLGEPRRR